MKKALVFLFLFTILCNLVFAQTDDLIQLTPLTSQLSQGEVYQTEIILKNPINPLKPQDIKLYSSTNILQPLAPFLKEISPNHYFLYFEISQTIQDGDYTLKIEDQSFLINNVLQQVTQEEPISILNSQPTIAITPGFFYLNLDKQAQIQITAKSQTDEPIAFQLPEYITHPYITEQTLTSNIPRTFTFSYDTTNAITSEIKFISNSKEYTIPILVEEQITQEESNKSNQTTQNQEGLKDPIGFRIEGSKLIKQINKEDSEEGNLYMYNKLETTLNNLNIKLTGNLNQIISLQQKSINSIQPLSNFSIYLSINKDKTPTLDYYSGDLIIYNEEYSSPLNIEIIIEETIKTESFPEQEVTVTETEQTTETASPVQDVIPWDLAGEYQEEAQENAAPIVAIILPLLVIAILVFILSGKKKKTKTKKFSDVIKNN